MLHECSEQLPDKSGILDQIELISSIKYALSVVARYMQKTCRQSHVIPLSSDMKNMLKAAAELCYKYGSAWPRFVQLILCYTSGKNHFRNKIIYV